jgi:ABC-type arginine transport system ATPase subunit
VDRLTETQAALLKIIPLERTKLEDYGNDSGDLHDRFRICAGSPTHVNRAYDGAWNLSFATVLDPPILLMDEPFSALDVQTRQLMGDELLRLWSSDRKSVIFVTHDLEDAIALSDRVVVVSAGPAARPVAEFAIDLPRPREVTEIRLTQRFLQLHTAIWQVLKAEVICSRDHADA